MNSSDCSVRWLLQRTFIYLAFLMYSTPVLAAQLTWTMEGTVYAVNAFTVPPSAVVVNAHWAGRFVYDTTTATSQDGACRNERTYNFSGEHNIFTMQIGSLVWSKPLAAIKVTDNLSCGPTVPIDAFGVDTLVSPFPYLGLVFQDANAPFDLVDRLDLPTTYADLRLQEATIITAVLLDSWGIANIRIDAATSVLSVTWGLAKALYR